MAQWLRDLRAHRAAAARATLRRLAYRNATVHVGDGWHGLPDHGPFDGIVVTACAHRVPPALREQLTIGGRLVMPIGPSDRIQNLRVLTRTGPRSFDHEDVLTVQFVPMKRSSSLPS